LLDEALTPRQLLGAVLVLGAVVLLQAFESRLPVTSDRFHK